VYGIVDYYNTKNNGTLEKMYKEETPLSESKEETITTVPLTETAIKNETVTNTTTAAKTKTKSSKKSKKNKIYVREFKFSNFSRGRILPKVVEDVKPVAEVKKENK
jgi:sorbitol-specific phosphotransferase system component IIBC